MKRSQPTTVPSQSQGAAAKTASSGTAFLGVTVLALTLCGCTVLVKPPPEPSIQSRVAVLSYAEGLAYLDNARTNMRQGLAKIDELDKATRIGVGAGVGGAGIATLFRAPTDAILGLLTLGGMGYSMNQLSTPAVQATVYAAGLDNLGCIEQTAARVHQEFAYPRSELERQLPILMNATAALATQMATARATPKPTPLLGNLISQSETALGTARQVVDGIQRFLGATNVGPEIYAGTSRTVDAVNAQLRAQAPDLNAIASSGTVFSNFVNSHRQLAAQAAAVQTKGVTTTITQGAQDGDSAANELLKALKNLQAVVVQAQLGLPTRYTGGEAILSCKTATPGDLPVTIDQAGPIELVAGGEAFNLTTAGSPPLSVGFEGYAPSATQLIVSQPARNVVSVAAPQGAMPRSYTLYVQQSTPRERRSAGIEIRVVAAPATSLATPPKVLASPADQKDLQDFLADRRLLGLGENVKSRSSTDWTDRVKKLENCFKLPLTGKVTAKLREGLAASTPVQNGDCPAPKAKPGTSTLGGSGQAPKPEPGPSAGAPATGASGPAPIPPPVKF